MSEDQTIGHTHTPDTHTPDTPFHRPPAPAPIDIEIPQQLTIDQILDMAKLPERRARICLRADLQAEYDRIIDELGTLVNAQGELIVDPDAAIGDQTPAARAQQLADDLEQVRKEMADATVAFLFRGMSADDLAVFEKAHRPKGQEADFSGYFIKLIASCAVEPALTEHDVRRIRGRIGANAFLALSQAAQAVNTSGGVDIPKSLNFSEVRAGS